jgi:hypothetical protein
LIDYITINGGIERLGSVESVWKLKLAVVLDREALEGELNCLECFNTKYVIGLYQPSKRLQDSFKSSAWVQQVTTRAKQVDKYSTSHLKIDSK